MPKIKTIGIIAPASATEADELDKVNIGISFLESLGLEVIQAKNVLNYDDNGDGMVTAGTVQERVDGFNEIWSNPKIDAVISMRGGYGCIQMLDKLDYDLVKKYPKPLLGYSDLTALHSALISKCGLQCFHTPMVSRIHEWKPESQKSFVELIEKLAERVLWGDLESLSFIKEKLIKESSDPNIADYKITGGNLTLLSTMLGTEYMPDLSNSILFIEEFNEPKYQVDRKLQQLKLAGAFEDIKGILVGTPTMTDFAYELLEDLAQEKRIALIKDIPVGHCEINLCLPLN